MKTPKSAAAREFLDDGMIRWEAYVTGGQPDTPAAARIFFVCMDDVFERPRYVPHASRSVPEATRALAAMSEDELVALLAESTPLE